MQKLKSGLKDIWGGFYRKRCLLPLGGIAGALVVGGALVLFTTGVRSLPAETFTKQTEVVLSVPYYGLLREAQVQDQRGQVIPVVDLRREFGKVELELFLEPGSHELALTLRPWIGLNPKVVSWTVVVDQTAPVLEFSATQGVVGEGGRFVVDQERFEVEGRTEPEVSLRLGARQIPVDREGRFQHTLSLQEGENQLRWTATDRAGNMTEEVIAVLWDVEPPKVVWRTEPGKAFETSMARFEFDTTDDSEVVAVSGRVLEAGGITLFRKGPERWVVQTDSLHEGEHVLELKIVDAVGRVTHAERTFVIDTTEEFGEAVLGLGARGRDVEMLHRRLKQFGFEDVPEGRVYTNQTAQAVEEYQRRNGWEITGRVEGETLLSLGPQVYVNLQEFSLVLDRPGLPPKRWTVASGTDIHPTTPGRYIVWEKVKDPTWLPPASDWAKNAKPEPPGPDNPLGSRWIGLDRGGLGIHGTNAPWTVGSAASHGCLRMVTEDVEELFGLVKLDMPVTIFSGSEKDDALHRLWPKEGPKTPPETSPTSG